jgi:ABC-type glycerol-3-phosphate transport system permease component
VGVVNFVKIWGEFMLALTLLPNPKWWTLGVGVFNYGEMLKQYSYPEMFACTILAIIPSLIVFIICKNVLFSIKIAGGVKG